MLFRSGKTEPVPKIEFHYSPHVVMDTLPHELVEIVLNYTVFRVPDRGSCMLVCRRWCDIVAKIPLETSICNVDIRLRFIHIVRQLINDMPRIINIRTMHARAIEVLIDFGSHIQTCGINVEDTQIADYYYYYNRQPDVTAHPIPTRIHEFRDSIRREFLGHLLPPFTYVRGHVMAWRHEYEVLMWALRPGTGAAHPCSLDPMRPSRAESAARVARCAPIGSALLFYRQIDDNISNW